MRERWPDHHNAPVDAWGSRRSRLLIVGLAPGLHGANRTGRPFFGDGSGSALFDALVASRWATPGERAPRLAGVRITNAVRCLPPENLPTAQEIARCNPYLAEEIDDVLGVRRRGVAILALGHGAWKALGMALRETRSLPTFEHGRIHALGGERWLASSYHPSRRNINTGRLRAEELTDLLGALRQRCT